MISHGLVIIAGCLILGFIFGRKSKLGKRDYLEKFKIGNAEYTASLIYEDCGGLQNDGTRLAIYYDVDKAKIIHQLDSWGKISDFPTVSSIIKNVSLYSGLDFQLPEITKGNFLLYDNRQSKELHSETEIETLISYSEDVDFSLAVWDAEKSIIYIVEYRT